MAIFKITFTPHDILEYTYEVEADNEELACLQALDDFRMDVGYDKSKDFIISDAEEETENDQRRMVKKADGYSC